MCDLLFPIAQSTSSNQSKKLFEIYGSNIKNNYFVDTCVSIINNEDSSYLNWYAKNALVKVNTLYAIEKSIDNNLFDKYINQLYINQLYINNMILSNVFDYCIECLKQDNGYFLDRKLIIEEMAKNIYILMNKKLK